MNNILKAFAKPFCELILKDKLKVIYFCLSLLLLTASEDTPLFILFLFVLNFCVACLLLRTVPLKDFNDDDEC
jgi:hypothetical protein